MEPEKVRISFQGQEQMVRVDDLRRLVMGTELAKMATYIATAVHRNNRGDSLVLDKTQFLQILADPRPDIRIKGPAQIGKTTIGLVRMLAGAELGLSAGWIMPKDDDRNRFVNDVVEKTIQFTPLYSKRVRGGSDSVKLKHFGNASLFFVSANSPSDLKAFTADQMFVDERDECDRDNLAIYPSRMNRSPYRFTFEGSTPTTPGDPPSKSEARADNIDSEFQNGDMCTWYITCDHCGKSQCMDWWEHVVKQTEDDQGRILDVQVRDHDWSPGSPNDLRPMCSNTNCGRPLNRLKQGVWVPKTKSLIIGSYEINRQACATGLPMGELATKYMSECPANLSKMQQFVNMHLGQVFRGGAASFTDEMFRRCADLHGGGYSMLSEHIGPCSAGIDVNAPYFSVHISTWAGEGAPVPQRKLWAGEVHGRTKLYELLRAFNVKGAVIDSQPEANMVREMQEEFARKVGDGANLVLAKYATQPMVEEMIESVPGEYPGALPRLVTLDRTATIDALHESHMLRKVAWFANWSGVCEGRVRDQMKKPVRRREQGENGADKWVWIGGPDHQLHAANLDRMASKIFKSRLFGSTGSQIQIIRQTGAANVPNLAKKSPIFIMRG